MKNYLFKIDESAPIIYKIIEDFYNIAPDTKKPYYMAEILIPITSIGAIKATHIQLYSTSLDWFKLSDIEIYNYDFKGTNATWCDANSDSELTKLIVIRSTNKREISEINYEVPICDPSLKGMENKIVSSILNQIIPLISNKKNLEETWQLKVSKTEDSELYNRLLNYKFAKNLTTSKALRELLNLSFVCLEHGIRIDPENGNLVKVQSINSIKIGSTAARPGQTGNEIIKMD